MVSVGYDEGVLFTWLKNRQRKKLLSAPFPAEWEDHLAANVRHYAHLPPAERERMQRIVRVVAAEKHWSGGRDFAVTDEIKVTIAGQASLLVLGFDEPHYFDGIESIIVYPRPYTQPASFRERYLIVPEAVPQYGEAWYRGPIVLSWENVLADGRAPGDGQNLVLHEFAHYVDALNGEFDGEPPLFGRQQRQDWRRVTEAEYLRLVGSAQRDETTLLDHYGARNKAEFFAVATECFFEQPAAMRQQHAELYALLSGLYRQDPAEWLPDAQVTARKPEPAEPPWEPDPRVFASRKTHALFMLAVECAYNDRHDLAERATSRVIELDPSDAEAHQQRAAARVKLHKYRDALDDCEAALRLDPRDQNTLRVRGAAYVGLQQYEEAIADLDRAIGKLHEDPEALYLRGLAWAALGKPRQAVDDLSWSIALNGFVADAYFERAKAHRQLGQTRKAKADLEKARQLDPQVGRRKSGQA
jgi:Mlc titration factor MtfA (ptsG expression regulator)/Tfp pilus assembly protein PilF